MTTNPPLSDIERAAKLLRDAKDQIARLDEDYKSAKAPLQAKLDKINALLLAEMQRLGADSIKTQFGTVMVRKTTTAVAGDWDAVYTFIAETGRLDMLQKRLANTAVLEYAEENGGTMPPGILQTTERAISLRKPTSKGE